MKILGLIFWIAVFAEIFFLILRVNNVIDAIFLKHEWWIRIGNLEIEIVRYNNPRCGHIQYTKRGFWVGNWYVGYRSLIK